MTDGWAKFGRGLSWKNLLFELGLDRKREDARAWSLSRLKKGFDKEIKQESVG